MSLLSSGLRSASLGLVVAAPLLFAQAPFGPQSQAPQPLTSMPNTPSLDPKAMDRTVNPCENFYLYSCGTWMKDNPVPADQSRWDVYSKLTYENQLYLWGLLLEAGKTDVTRTANQQKIGDMFYACMNESQVEQLGVTAGSQPN